MITDRLNKDAIIDDLGFRAGWLEKTVQMNLAALTAALASPNPTSESLRFAIEGLKLATEKSLTELQVCARDRMVAFAAPPSAKILAMFKPSPIDQPGQSGVEAVGVGA